MVNAAGAVLPEAESLIDEIPNNAMPEPKQALVVFSPSGKRGHFPVGTPVLQAARSLGVDIDSICGGRALCGRCQVEAVAGQFPKESIVSSPEQLTEAGEDEKRLSDKGLLKPTCRLACQAKVLGDIRIDVPAGSQVHQQVVRKGFETHPIELDPVIHLYFTEVGQPTVDSGENGLQCLRQALERDWGLTGLDADAAVLQTVESTLRKNRRQVTVAVRDGQRIAAIWPGLIKHVFGVAVDVGSTTIAAHLCDLSSGEVLSSVGAMNPQIRFGEDLMSRVSYAMLNTGGASQMTAAVRRAINELLERVVTEAGIDAGQVLEMTLVGNPIMHHLVLGLDPTPLGTAPFTLATDKAVELTASELDLSLPAGARAYFLPCIAGHVGADTAGVMLAEMPWESDQVSLLIDVGTNAELLLGNRDKLLAASSPTGPAFEGAQISAGQRAAPGAIERVRIDPETLEPRFRVIGGECWSDEAGFADETDKRGVSGICGSGIIEAVACMYLAGIITPDGVIDGAMAERNSRIQPDGRTYSYLLHAGEPEIRIRQTDIRAIQLAKAALHAGARLLMDRMGVNKVDRIRLAGAFGSHIDVRYAMILGMLPDCNLDKVSAAG
ncbi:MAG: ASKHA domain-containing protein, partial [Xanthomonadales bacterium]|nr:ASKHA domain-containing protein [Xanthomonadales bacterium]